VRRSSSAAVRGRQETIVCATSIGHNRPVSSSLAHQSAVAPFLIGGVIAGAFTTIVNLGNAGVRLLQLIGRRANGVVESIEPVTGEDLQPLRRPAVTFTTHRGERAALFDPRHRHARRPAGRGTPLIRDGLSTDTPTCDRPAPLGVRIRRVPAAALGKG
jgi:hypothetical protein